jgi:hypothetical protein
LSALRADAKTGLPGIPSKCFAAPLALCPGPIRST